VAFVPGKYFYPRTGDGLATMRLNFTNVSIAQIHHAINTLAEVLHEHTEAAINKKRSE
jgi:DNA-binding transcriptional MocR family regulator